MFTPWQLPSGLNRLVSLDESLNLCLEYRCRLVVPCKRSFPKWRWWMSPERVARRRVLMLIAILSGPTMHTFRHLCRDGVALPVVGD
jgi:hypothetical protein